MVLKSQNKEIPIKKNRPNREFISSSGKMKQIVPTKTKK